MPNKPVRAAAEGMPDVNRRAILTGIGAAAAASVTLRKAESSGMGDAGLSDAELFRIEAEFNAAYQRFDAAFTAFSEAERRFLALRPPKPVQKKLMPENWRPAWLAGNATEAQERAIGRRVRENARRQAEWKAACDEIDGQCGCSAALAEQESALEAACEIAATLRETPAQTLAGVMAKIRVYDSLGFDEEEFFESITADIKAMA